MPLHFLEKIISHENISSGSSPNIDLGNNDQQSEIITSEQQVHALIKKLFQNHELLSVNIDNSDIVYSSLILEINTQEQYLVLDELYPKTSEYEILTNDKMTVSHNSAGVFTSFNSYIEAIANNGSEAYYKVPIPKQLIYHQRRGYRRVPVSLSNPLRATLSSEHGLIGHCEIRDLSIGGFSARLLHLPATRFLVGDRIPKCMIQMHNGDKIFAPIEIRRVDHVFSSGVIKIGVQFINLKKSDERLIEKFVAQIDRDLIRRTKV